MSGYTSKSIRHRLCLCSIAVGATLSSALASAAEEDSFNLVEVVVTAQRVESTVQKTPVAVSAFDANAIETKQIDDVMSLLNNVPNFAGALNVTLPTAVSLFIRGIGSTDSSISADPPVGLYIDDVVVARQQLNNAGVFDLQRVEVLRGPQGTLYGRNTAAGAVKMITNPAIDANEGWLEAGFGNYSSKMVRGVLNASLAPDKLFARGSFVFNDRDGFAQNLTTGQDVNDLSSWAFHGALRFLASENLELNVKVDSSKVNSDGILGQDVAGTYVPSTGDLFVLHSGSYPRNEGRTHGINGYIDWDITDTLHFRSITGYRFTAQDYSVDFTDQPIPADLNDSIAKSQQYTEELQLTGQLTERFNFVTGFYAMRETGRQQFGPQLFRNYSRVNGVFPPPGTVNAAQDPAFVYNEDYRLKTTSYAVYGQGSYSFTDALNLEVGLRWTHDDKRYTVSAVQGPPAAPVFLFNTATVVATTGQPSSKTFSQVTPHVGLNYEFAPGIMGYASYTEGFQSGGWFGRVRAPAALVLYNNNTVTAYEAGLKNTFLDGRARLNLAAFYTENKDLPTSYASLTRPGSFQVASLNPTIWGVEAEGAVRITTGLTLNGSVGWMDYKYVDFDLLPAEVKPNIKPDLRYAPHYTAKLGLEYTAPLSGDWTLRLSNYYAYSSKQFSNPANSLAGLQAARTLVDAGVTLEAPGDKYSVTLSCANCTDKHYFGNLIDFGGVRGGALPTTVLYAADPRTYQVSLKARF